MDNVARAAQPQPGDPPSDLKGNVCEHIVARSQWAASKFMYEFALGPGHVDLGTIQRGAFVAVGATGAKPTAVRIKRKWLAVIFNRWSYGALLRTARFRRFRM